jgi:hypothetical protein
MMMQQAGGGDASNAGLAGRSKREGRGWPSMIQLTPQMKILVAVERWMAGRGSTRELHQSHVSEWMH